jgi:hypothetical protein
MKRIFFLFLGMIAAQSWAQTDVTLNINHKLGAEPFTLDAVAENNLGESFRATRLEYYISQFSIVHDGGTITDVPLEVLDLVNPGEETVTSIPLGSFDVTTVERIQFYIGVQQPENNADPTLWPEDHPLAPKSPSMHWGWTAGYRFLAFEGEAGDGFSQVFQLHGLDNLNYFRTWSEVEVNMVDGVMELDITADYVEALRDISIAGGVISHGGSGSALKALENFRDFVFGTNTASLYASAAKMKFDIFPNPSADKTVQLQLDEKANDLSIQITNPLGQIIQAIQVNSQNLVELTFPESGIYMVSIVNSDQIIATKKVVIQ